MNEIADSLKELFHKINDFFDIFDLSFFVSGAVVVSAVGLWIRLNSPELLMSAEGGLFVLIIVLACYVNGLICFASGRSIRKWLGFEKRRTDLEKKFREILDGHGLSSETPYKEYLSRTESRGMWRLYIRLWAEIRQEPTLAPSYSLMRRYWVMAATYDGLAMAILVWAVFVLVSASGFQCAPQISPVLGIPVILILVFFSYVCLREAGRYERNQIEEMIATMAVRKQKNNGS